MKKILVGLFAAVAVLSFGTGAMAKVDWGAGTQQKAKRSEPAVLVGGGLTNGADSDFGVGARVEYPLGFLVPNLSVVGSYNYFFPGSYGSWWEFNANALYSFRVNDKITPYAGAGFNYASWEYTWVAPNYYYGGYGAREISVSDTMTSLNILGGCKFDLNIVVIPFVEGRIGLGDNDQLEITAGVLYGF